MKLITKNIVPAEIISISVFLKQKSSMLSACFAQSLVKLAIF